MSNYIVINCPAACRNVSQHPICRVLSDIRRWTWWFYLHHLLSLCLDTSTIPDTRF